MEVCMRSRRESRAKIKNKYYFLRNAMCITTIKLRGVTD